MYDPIELFGRYVLTGIILWAAAFVMMTIRLLWIAFKPESGGVFEFLDRFNPPNNSGKKAHSLVVVMRMILWPYGLIWAVHTYMKAETEAINKTIEFNEKRES